MKVLCAIICVMGTLTAIPTFAAMLKPAAIELFEVDVHNNKLKPLERVGKKQSQIIVEKIDYMLLECHSDYPVEWVYTGNGIPINKIDMSISYKRSTTERKRNDLDSHEYISSLFLGPLKEHHTGRYDCSRTDNVKRSGEPNVYIYVPGLDLFPSKQGTTIQINPSATTAFLPCPVTHPDVEVTVFKREEGKYTLVANSTEDKNFNPQKGIHINWKDFRNREGMYVCSGFYDGRAQDVEHLIEIKPYSEDPAPPNFQEYRRRPEEQTCRTHMDCPSMMNCETDFICRNPCIGRCGIGSMCTIVDFIPHCYCRAGYIGDPTMECIRVL